MSSISTQLSSEGFARSLLLDGYAEISVDGYATITMVPKPNHHHSIDYRYHLMYWDDELQQLLEKTIDECNEFLNFLVPKST